MVLLVTYDVCFIKHLNVILTKRYADFNLGGVFIGGSGEIRTHGGLTSSAVFKTAAFNRSATLPIFTII
ncbi:MAG: hypothetical protein RI956_195 [Pseudomonadota bacterium]